jgi:hypothetical protein
LCACNMPQFFLILSLQWDWWMVSCISFKVIFLQRNSGTMFRPSLYADSIYWGTTIIRYAWIICKHILRCGEKILTTNFSPCYRQCHVKRNKNSDSRSRQRTAGGGLPRQGRSSICNENASGVRPMGRCTTNTHNGQSRRGGLQSACDRSWNRWWGVVYAACSVFVIWCQCKMTRICKRAVVKCNRL